ncbi:MAG: Gfo/Idh/MocA family oxidoreductase [Acidimicrobiaceae bacterium]|nr:Gfo/Idh/MocA family oxidoreductase [Acidimicrobiaceae bacterium]MYF43938.1 Gfo/Idh/MocA family oxidoreductase [Acidimicrobiaceae bacterium]
MSATHRGPLLAVIGAGTRGYGYARLAAAAGARIVAVAEPDDRRRHRLIKHCGSPTTRQAADWETLEMDVGDVDGVIIATMDDMHVGPTLRFAPLGVPMLLEKPIARSWEDCCRLRVGLGDDAPPILVAHVLRYAPYTRLLHSLIADGALGDIVNVHHLEPVGFWHFAHSYVRGNWHSTATAADLMVAKACHDVDWIMQLIDSECVAVSSFASLSHFRPESRPVGAADRCVDCSIDCVYDARSIYLDTARDGDFSWPVEAIVVEHTTAEVVDALDNSRYGRCVYTGDNDMPDTQVASLLFAGGQTATITVSAFTELRSRLTVVSGTRAEATVTAAGVELYSFATRRRRFCNADGRGSSGLNASHGGGGDAALVDRYLSEIDHPTEAGRAAFAEALRTHRVTFAIEEARRRGQVVDPRDLPSSIASDEHREV